MFVNSPSPEMDTSINIISNLSHSQLIGGPTNTQISSFLNNQGWLIQKTKLSEDISSSDSKDTLSQSWGSPENHGSEETNISGRESFSL